MNFRADRARELSRAFLANDFSGFNRRTRVHPSVYATLTRYADDIDAPCAFEPDNLSNTFGEYLEKLERTQLRIAETEKYAHVTFFFSGGREVPYAGEDRILIPSPKVATYDLQPEMSAREVTDRLVEAIVSRHYDAIICNFANADMVGHTGIFDAAVQAVETLDECLGRIVDRGSRHERRVSDHGRPRQRRADVRRNDRAGAHRTYVRTGPTGLRRRPESAFSHRRNTGRRRADAADVDAIAGAEGDDRTIVDRSVRVHAPKRVDLTMFRWRKRLAWLTLAWVALSPTLIGAAEDMSKARRDIDGITKKLNDLDAWFSDATRRQRDLQKELRSTDQSIADTSSDIREIEAELKRIAKDLADLNAQMKTLNDTARRAGEADRKSPRGRLPFIR